MAAQVNREFQSGHGCQFGEDGRVGRCQCIREEDEPGRGRCRVVVKQPDPGTQPCFCVAAERTGGSNRPDFRRSCERHEGRRDGENCTVLPMRHDWRRGSENGGLQRSSGTQNRPGSGVCLILRSHAGPCGRDGASAANRFRRDVERCADCAVEPAGDASQDARLCAGNAGSRSCEGQSAVQTAKAPEVSRSRQLSAERPLQEAGDGERRGRFRAGASGLP